MLSRKEYNGRVSYDEYVRRFNLSEVAKKEALLARQKAQNLIPKIPSKKTITDAAKDKAKDEFRKAVEKQTGINTKEVEEAYDAVKGGAPKTPADKRKKNEIITGIAINRAVIPNTDELSETEQNRAKLSKASKIAYMNDDDFRTAQDYMNENNLGEIDKELSNSSSLVIKTPDGDTEIHYRGTAITNKPNYQDLITDASIITGTEQGVLANSNLGKPSQLIEAEQQLQRTLGKYGSVEHLGGYSRGGGMALSLGNKYNIPTTTFNPLVGPKTIAGSNSTTAKHTIIRTTEDPTTIGLAFSSPNSDNWEVKAIKPLDKYSSNIPLKNVYDAHRLDNFTEDGPRKIQEAEITKAQNNQVSASRKQLERVMLGDMRDSIRNGDSFTEYMTKFNPGDSQITPNGKRLKGTRIYGNDPYTEGWRSAGGRFSEGEAKFINDVRENGENAEPHREPNEIRNSDDAERFLLDYNQDGTPKEKLPNLKEELTPPNEIASELNRPIGEEEKALINNLNNSDSKFKLSKSEMNEYKPGARSDGALAAKHREAEQEHYEAIQTHDDIASAHVEHSPNNKTWRSANLTNLAIGYGIGMGVQSVAGLIPGEKEFEETVGGRATSDIVKGASTGLLQGLAQKNLGGLVKNTSLASIVGAPEEVALLPEAVGGAAGYVAGDYAAEGASKLAKLAGGSKNIQELSGDVVGGGVGGGVGGLATFATAVAADTLLGTEYGSFLGPEGAVAGAIIGTGLGLAAATYSQGISGLEGDVEEIGSGIKKGLSSIGSAISSWF
jgi:hypothetical protein